MEGVIYIYISTLNVTRSTCNVSYLIVVTLYVVRTLVVVTGLYMREYVHINNADGLPMKERRNLKSLVDAENENRRTLYGEVAKALKIDSSQIEKIEKIFAKEWKESLK